MNMKKEQENDLELEFNFDLNKIKDIIKNNSFFISFCFFLFIIVFSVSFDNNLIKYACEVMP